MKALPIILFAGILTLCTARPAHAVMTEYSTTNRTVAVTNVLPTSEVRPLAAYVIFPAPATGVVSISRVTRGVAVPLARHAFTNATALTWLPPADFPIRRGEAFAISSTVARFTLQLESRAEGGAVVRTEATEWYDEGKPFAFGSAGGGSTQVTVTNAPQFVVTNYFVVTNQITVSAGSSGPRFDVGPDGEYIATNTVNLAGYGLTAMNDDGSPAALAITGRVANLGQAGSTITIKGGTAADSSGELGGEVVIAGGDGPAGSANAPGAVVVRGGDGVAGTYDYAGATLTLRGGNGGGGSGSSGADVLLSGGTGGNLDGKVIIEGNSDHSTPGSAGIHLRLSGADLRVSTDGGATSTAGVTEDVVVGDGAAGTLTLRFLKGIYIGHTVP